MRNNLQFAIGNTQVTLQPVKPPRATTYSACRQGIDVAYQVFDSGREETVDTRFYIDAKNYNELPSKGDILTDGETKYKVNESNTDARGITLRIDCVRIHQR